MLRVLDELADGFHAAGGGRPSRRVASSVALADQFGDGLITPARWTAVQRRARCRLPCLIFSDGHYRLPHGWVTVWDLAAYVAGRGSHWKPPAECTTAAWREAQVFAGVRSVLMDCGNLSREQVVRSARLVEDLGMD